MNASTHNFSLVARDFFPSPVLSDGNCLFRAVSKSIYRTEVEHFRLRLLSSLEIFKHPEMYDLQTPQFHEYIKDFNAECTTSYRDILEDVSNPGGFTGLIHFRSIFFFSSRIKYTLFFKPSGIEV